MGSKGILNHGFFLVMILLISSEVFAVKDLAETSNSIDTSKEHHEKTKGGTFNVAQGCRCCGRIPFRRGCRCCPDEVQAQPDHN